MHQKILKMPIEDVKKELYKAKILSPELEEKFRVRRALLTDEQRKKKMEKVQKLGKDFGIKLRPFNMELLVQMEKDIESTRMDKRKKREPTKIDRTIQKIYAFYAKKKAQLEELEQRTNITAISAAEKEEMRQALLKRRKKQ